MESLLSERPDHSRATAGAAGEPPWSVEEVRARHPWPAFADDPRRVELLWHHDLPLAADDVWRVVSDMSRLNRALGLHEMTFADDGPVRRGRARIGGFRHEWVEVPWNWVAGQWLESMRIYQRGFFHAVYAVFHVQPLAAATRLHVYFGIVPRGALGRAVARLSFPRMQAAYAKVLAQVVDASARGRRPELEMAAPVLAPGAAARLHAIGRDLVERGLDATAIGRLVTWIETGDEQDLYRIQVRERARAWGVAEDGLLAVCLHATRAGLLTLSWDAVCPHCRGVTGEVGALGDLAAHGACAVCGIDFTTDRAEAVEITFHVHPSIRDVPRRTFCSAEPATKDHIRVQHVVAPGGEVTVMPQLGAGRWRLRVRGEKRYGYLDVGPGSGTDAPGGELVWRAGDPPAEHPAARAAVRLVNDSSEDRTFVIESSQWNDIALRPGKLLSFPEFRDLFSEEYLADDVQLSVGEQTLLFTDVVGSTAMYAERGDPAAFVEVKRHFADVFALLRRHRGTLVKTIGDAAMGAFCDPLDAVRAARDIHDTFAPGRGDCSVRLRVSLHTGPCLAVKLNADIDYFGTTVNVAAKLQALAEAWQIAMSEATYQAPGVAAWIAAQGAEVELVSLEHKAFSAPVAARRWTVHRSSRT
jgi:class 3 adenylate cyclase